MCISVGVFNLFGRSGIAETFGELSGLMPKGVAIADPTKVGHHAIGMIPGEACLCCVDLSMTAAHNGLRQAMPDELDDEFDEADVTLVVVTPC